MCIKQFSVPDVHIFSYCTLASPELKSCTPVMPMANYFNADWELSINTRKKVEKGQNPKKRHCQFGKGRLVHQQLRICTNQTVLDMKEKYERKAKGA